MDFSQQRARNWNLIKKTRLPTNATQTIRECVYLVTLVVASGHVTKMAVTVTPFDLP